MFRGRGGFLFLLIVIALAVGAFLLLRGRGAFPRLLGPRQEVPAIPLDLQTLIPAGWEVLPDPQLECSFDDDADLERLLIYRYNGTTVQRSLEADAEPVAFAPYGGVIFDTQTSSLEPQPDPPGAYRPSNIVPYLLLPDFYPGKGEGYLGDTGVSVRYAPLAQAGAGCKTEEINIFGYSGGTLPTRLSTFRWQGREAGYQGAHFAGNARVESDVAPAGGNRVTRVTTYNRLLNHRSVLCEVTGYIRNEGELRFTQDASARTIDFCFNAPSEPVYPEGVVVALLRGRTSGSGSPAAYILNNAVLPPGLNLLDPARPAYNILSVGNPADVAPVPTGGEWCSGAQIGPAMAAAAPTEAPTAAPTSASTPSPSGALWCGRERVRVETRIVLNGETRDVGWVLITVRPDLPGGGVYWRVQEAELQ